MAEADVATGEPDARRVVAGWFDRHVDAIHAYVCRRAGEQVARDVTAETFRVALEDFDRFDPARGHERAWLYGIASNLLRRHWRTECRLRQTQRRSVRGESGPSDPYVVVDARLDARHDVERVLAAVEQLDEEDRDLLFLVVWEQLSSAEVAVALGIPAGTVRTRLKRIRARLRDQARSSAWTS
jgi:RNA polymerase sigma factor (sigma-70 family)